jgi:hypothetical protein
MTRSRFDSRLRVAAAMTFVLITSSAAAQAPAAERVKPDGFSLISVGASQLSANGFSSTGISAGYGTVVSKVMLGVDLAYFSESGVTTLSTLASIGYAMGPYRNKDISANSSNKHVAFAPVVGLYSSTSDVVGSETTYDPFAGGIVMAPLKDPLLMKMGAGFIFPDGGHTFYLHLGLGFRF